MADVHWRERLTSLSDETVFPDLELKILSTDEVVLVSKASTSTTPAREIQPDHPIATGGYADVYKALLRRKGAKEFVEVVVKVIRGAHIDANDDEKMALYIKRLRREYRVWGSLSHPNVVRLEGIFIHSALPSAGLVAEYKPYMDLLKFMREGENFDRISMVQGIACGLAYLHENQVVHGDLTSSNILVDKSDTGGFVPLISDFGKSRLVGVKGCTTNMGNTPTLARPPEFLACDSAEEVTNRSILVAASDVYSMSLIFLEVITGKKAYCEEKIAEYKIVGRIVQSHLRPTREKYPTLNRSYDYVWPIMEDCWKDSPPDRISSQEAYTRLRRAQAHAPAVQLAPVLLQSAHSIN